MEKKWTKEEIRERIQKEDKWLYRGLVVIYERQTYEEQTYEATIKSNGVGFTGADARIMTYLAKWVIAKKVLNDKWKEVARQKLLKYAGQLAKIANKEI